MLTLLLWTLAGCATEPTVLCACTDDVVCAAFSLDQVPADWDQTQTALCQAQGDPDCACSCQVVPADGQGT